MISSVDLTGPIHRIYPSLSDITNGTIRFFEPGGKSVIGYVQMTDGEIQLLSQARGISALGDSALPITESVLAKVVKNLEEEQDRKIQSIAAAKAREEAERSRASRARTEADLAEYRHHHISDSGKYSVAVLVVDENQDQNASFAQIWVDHLRKQNLTATASFFKPAFIEDGLFAKVFAGQSDVLDRLPLTNAISALLLGSQSTAYMTNSGEFEGLITASMVLEVDARSSSTLQSFFRITVSAKGAGFSKDVAKEIAQDRCLTRLENGSFEAIAKRINEQAPK